MVEGRILGIRIASPICICVSSQGLNRASTNVKVIGQCALGISGDTLDQHEMGLTGIIHKETYLIYNMPSRDE
jgi:hypothetical protein